MLNKIIRYPLDLTGESPDNLVVGEIHDLPNRRIRAIATEYGAYFTNSMRVTDLTTNKVLTKDQYRVDQLYAVPTGWTGKEICAIVLITDETVSNRVSLNYQALGGEFAYSATAIIQQIEALKLDDRPVAWGDIIGKPTKFPPDYHLHDIGDVFGFEYVCHALERIEKAIALGDAASHDQIYQYIDKVIGTTTDIIDALTGRLNAHINDKDNPHVVTPTQLNVYIKQEVDQRVNAVQTSLNNHVNDKGNPHGVTPGQINAFTKEEVQALIVMVQGMIEPKLGNHIADRNNPHGVTAAQTGAYNKNEVDSKFAASNNALLAHDGDTNAHPFIRSFATSEANRGRNEANANTQAVMTARGIWDNSVDISGQNLTTRRPSGRYYGQNLANAPTAAWWFADIRWASINYCAITLHSLDAPYSSYEIIIQNGVYRGPFLCFNSGNMTFEY